jgi:Nickel responsive protein SCO4226-like
MPRYLVERTFPDGLAIPIDDDGTAVVEKVVAKNAGNGVTWVHSYVSGDKRKTYCIYDGPSEDAIRSSAEANGLPVDSIVPVTVLDPYFYH